MDPFCRISFKMLIRHGSATAAIARSRNLSGSIEFIPLKDTVLVFCSMSKAQAYFDSPLGKMLITAENEMITGIRFNSNENPISETTPVIARCCEQLEEYFTGRRRVFSLPLSQEGTPFQQQVWINLEKIGYGQTISYRQLSKLIGNVKAIRAVGNANSKNKIAVVIPCHRVIGSSGNLVGYAGEIWRKQWLLLHEARYGLGVQELFPISAQ